MNTGSVEFQHFSGYNTNENVYNFSKIIIKHIISIEDWGISSMKERQNSLNKVPTSFTYWDYINAFSKVLYYNNERHKHTWFIKVCVKIFADPIPNWFLNWWSYHGPTVKILPDPFLKLYKNWVKVSLDLNDLYHSDHICYMEQIEQIYFFIEFSTPWIHKWTPELGFTEEQISLVGLDFSKIQDYDTIPHKGIVADNSVKHIARRISIQDGNKEEMIKEYLEEFRKNLLLNITHYEKSYTSMRSETSDDIADDAQEVQPCELEKTMSEDMMSKAEDFLRELKKKDKILPSGIYSRCTNDDMENPWVTKGRGRGNNPRGRGRSSPSSSRSSYGSSSSNTPIIQNRGMSLYNLNSRVQEKPSSLIHLEDIPESGLLYAKLQEFLTQKQGDTFASIAKEEVDNIKTYEKVEKREMIFLLENSDIQRIKEPWKIFRRYFVNGIYFPGIEFQHFSGYNTSENVYNFSKMIIKHIIHIEDWGISSMTEV
ncbi:hypothetical protein H5410_060439 [Solanum commersonii]|uniref:Uncharacterized protein n=1 Tax=Solanum commersonii TaxID=4109 RepID=A0A9J5W5F6_SOLCO|nr:hypothetical protein H5410_060439 [Solanum commersonii]